MIETAHKKGQTGFDESASKRILQHYGINVVKETTVKTPEEVYTCIRNTDFPVVLKGLGKNILHKTERGLVHLNLTTSQMVADAVANIQKRAGKDLEGFLIQPHVQGKRELMAGLFRDRQFGPVVVFGLGGVLTEALRDITFRLAPLTERDAIEMIGEIKAKDLLSDFRGEKAVDSNALKNTLLGLSRLAIEHPLVSEVDINPLLVDAQGEFVAVDSLITLSPTQETSAHPKPMPPEAIGKLFYPKSIAFIGASSQMGKWGHMLLSSTISGGFTGDAYFVNPKGGLIAGKKAYRSILDLPGSVDLAIVSIPAKFVQDIIPQLRKKRIKSMVLITSGFSETGARGKELEKDLISAASKADILILGPNTMGICNPHINFFCIGAVVRPLKGSTAVVAQSGNMGIQLLAFAERQGIGIRAFSGSGNEAMITIEDYLNCFEIDDLTHTVMLYIESIKNGRRFFESACRLSQKKPIVLLKGGQTKEGTRAAASHTGAMASDTKVFDAACRQAGIIKVDHPMDLLDLSAAFSSLPLPKGKRAAIMTLGGGWGVVTADLCAMFGLQVPDLPPHIVDLIDKILPPYWSRANPIDLVGEKDLSIPIPVMEELLKWDGCDAVINLGILGRRTYLKRLAEAVETADSSYSKTFLNEAVQVFEDFEKQYVEQIVRLMETYDKPVYGVSLLIDDKDRTVHRVPGSDFKGVFYETPERAVMAFAKMYEYNRYINR